MNSQLADRILERRDIKHDFSKFVNVMQILMHSSNLLFVYSGKWPNSFIEFLETFFWKT